MSAKRIKSVVPEDIQFKVLLTLEEAAWLLGVSKSRVESLITVQRRKDSPRLRPVREGRSVRVARVDLDRYVAKLRAEAGIH